MVELPALIEAVTLPAAVTAVEEAFRALARRTVVQPPPLGLDLPGGQVHVKSAQLGPHEPVVVKVATGFPRNPERGLPAGDGAMVVLDAQTGQLRAVLLDRGWLTDVRTAAATAVAVRHLTGPPPRRRVAMLGTGVQADLTLRTLAAADLLAPDVVVWGRSPGAAHRLAELHQELAHSVTAAATAADAVAGADVVITVTAARAPILSGAWLAPDALVVAVGADSPGKRECDSDVLTRTTLIVADAKEQALRLGELQHAPAGVLGARIVELAHVVEPSGGSSETLVGIRLCDLTGVSAADAAIATVALTAILPNDGVTPEQG